MTGLTSKDYHKLDAPLRKITSSKISLKADDRKWYNEYLIEILERNVIPAMADADDLFKCLYKRLMYSGSYYEKLKISEPNEFDLNMEMLLPAQDSDIQVLNTEHHGFVRVQVNKFDEKKVGRCFKDYGEGQRRLTRWLDDCGMLKRKHVLEWMQGVVDKALRSVNMDDVKIRRSISGPAITLNVLARVPGKGMMTFSIDLVPVFIFGKYHWPKQPVRQPVIPEMPMWCVVPKSPGFMVQETHWRISFYDQEKRMMTRLDGMKHIIKLIKLLRDCQKWDQLSSYYIKTVFLWEMEIRDRQFWRQSIGFLFIHMLKQLVYHLKMNGAIPFYWDQHYSLISALPPALIVNIANRMDVIIKNIERNLPQNPDFVKAYFPGCERSDEGAAQKGRNFPNSGFTAIERPRQPPGQLQQQEGIGTWGAVGIGAAVVGITALGASLFMTLGRQRRN